MPASAAAQGDNNDGLPSATWVTADATADLIILAGAAALDLYHRHPHVAQDEILPDDIRAQTHMTLRNLFEILRNEKLSWKNVVKITRFQKDINHSPAVEEVMRLHFGNWWPSMSAVQIERLSAPTSLLELEIVAIGPR